MFWVCDVKQMSAYEGAAYLVGSEMYIGDRRDASGMLPVPPVLRREDDDG